MRLWPSGSPTIRRIEKTGNSTGCNRMHENQHPEMVWTRGQARWLPRNQTGAQIHHPIKIAGPRRPRITLFWNYWRLAGSRKWTPSTGKPGVLAIRDAPPIPASWDKTVSDDDDFGSSDIVIIWMWCCQLLPVHVVALIIRCQDIQANLV